MKVPTNYSRPQGNKADIIYTVPNFKIVEGKEDSYLVQYMKKYEDDLDAKNAKRNFESIRAYCFGDLILRIDDHGYLDFVCKQTNKSLCFVNPGGFKMIAELYYELTKTTE